ncbi:MAG: alpha/beta hydrolase, partial [Paramuribaculum sp.]|nr:alpha/beta hydrolase [Paramuribaculum sp.]
MKHSLLAFLAAVLSFMTVDAHDITGTWSGILKINPQNSMRLVFHIAQDSITMDSPDQNAYGIEGQLRYLSDDSLSMGVTGLRMNFTGKLINDSLVGTFRQGPFTVPLTLAAGVKRAKRPQTPQPPFPYT